MSGSPASAELPKSERPALASAIHVRTVTLGFDPERGSPAARERAIPEFFATAERLFVEAQRPLRTRRLVLPAMNDRPRFSRTNHLSIVKWVADLAANAGARWFCVPFTLFGTDIELATATALEVVRRHDRAFVNLKIAEGGQVQRAGILEVARFVLAVSRQSRNGYDNFRVGASCNCPAGTPFFPFTHHDGGEDSFAVALEVPGLFARVLDESAGLGLHELRERFCARLEQELRLIDGLGLQLEHATGVAYRGIDASLAPYPEPNGSVAQLLERLGVDDYGTSGTLFFTAFLSDVLRASLERSGARRVGFNGVMASLLEDPKLAECCSRKTFEMDALLSFAAVCGCGLDMVPIPGDAYPEEIASLMLDVAAMSSALGKPLGVRLLPIPRKNSNEMTDFGHDFFHNCRVLPLRNRSVARALFADPPFALLSPLKPLPEEPRR